MELFTIRKNAENQDFLSGLGDSIVDYPQLSTSYQHIVDNMIYLSTNGVKGKKNRKTGKKYA